jgi:hypothetical protein
MAARRRVSYKASAGIFLAYGAKIKSHKIKQLQTGFRLAERPIEPVK